MDDEQYITLAIGFDQERFWGVAHGPGNFIVRTTGRTVEKIIGNINKYVVAYKKKKPKFVFWQHVDITVIKYSFEYDLTAFFKVYTELKISSVAKLAGLNESLIRQYASGKKTPSINQVEKIENAIHDYGKQLQGISFFI